MTNAQLAGAVKRRLRKFFGRFPQVKLAQGRLEDLVAYSCDSEEPECLAIIGDTGTGKTTLIENFVQSKPRVEHPELTEVQVLYVEVPAKCSVKMLAALMLRALGSPFWNRGDEVERTDQLVTLLKGCRVRMIIIDEVNHLADRGAEKSHYHVGDWIKQLIRLSQLPVILAGTPAAAILWDTNEQLADRFREQIVLQPLSMEGNRQRELRSVLGAFLGLMNGVPCIDITEEAHAKSIAFATAGRLRDIRRLLVRAVEIAANQPSFAITRSTLAQAFLQVIWREAPDKRNPFSPKFDGLPLTKLGEPFAPRRSLRK
ncbi:TniB family NTP-binding protein [Roseateles microcysteis]|uniref:TniB family NTP-binding protein n=1 Tax=Roseateles microcysteis TaxID=3119057 RepID=UPI002FE69F98